MIYYKFTASTPYCGTENEFYLKYENKPKEDELAATANQFAVDNGQDFEYLVTGWEDDNFDDEEEKQEALDNYYADCECSYEEITEEEYKENGGV